MRTTIQNLEIWREWEMDSLAESAIRNHMAKNYPSLTTGTIVIIHFHTEERKAAMLEFVRANRSAITYSYDYKVVVVIVFKEESLAMQFYLTYV